MYIDIVDHDVLICYNNLEIFHTTCTVFQYSFGDHKN